mmetsp:Transcript_32423/g.45260  ORF Transcript_32423/g.45260 Transcript_32423/m.45260 type:complete len:810 (-) Transcript_32423:188-2617(-)
MRKSRLKLLVSRSPTKKKIVWHDECKDSDRKSRVAGGVSSDRYEKARTAFVSMAKMREKGDDTAEGENKKGILKMAPPKKFSNLHEGGRRDERIRKSSPSSDESFGGFFQSRGRSKAPTDTSITSVDSNVSDPLGKSSSNLGMRSTRINRSKINRNGSNQLLNLGMSSTRINRSRSNRRLGANSSMMSIAESYSSSLYGFSVSKASLASFSRSEVMSWDNKKRDLYIFKRTLKRMRLSQARKRRHNVDSIQIFCRELRFKLNLKQNTQLIKWIGYMGSMRYARASRRRVHYDKLICSDIVDEGGESLDPRHRIREALWNNARVVVKLSKFRPGDKKTQWQILAETPKSHYVEVKIVYDGPPPLESKHVLMYGNHNGYEDAVHMVNEADGKFTATLKVPDGWKLKFFFDVDHNKQLSYSYDSENLEVRRGLIFEQNTKMCGTKHSAPEIEKEPNLLSMMEKKTLWNKILGNEVKKVKKLKRWRYQIPGLPEGENHDRLFSLDWREVQLNDVVPLAEDRKRIGEVMKLQWNNLQQIYKFHSCQREPLFYLSRMDFINLIGAQKMYDRKLKPSDTEDIFERVNIPEDYGSDSDMEGLEDGAKGGFNIVEQEDNPNTLFVRSEFLEALVRISLRKYPEMDAEVAFDTLLETYILKNEQRCVEEISKFRDLMTEPDVKAAFRPYLEKLYKRTFLKVAGLDHLEASEGSDTISWTEFSSFLRHRGFLATSKSISNRGLTRREASMSFGLPIEPKLSNALPEMEWAAFLEMLLRVSGFMFKNPKNSWPEVVKLMCKELSGNMGGHLRIHHGYKSLH